MIAEVLVVLLLLLVIAVTWPSVPWGYAKWGIVLVLVPAVFITYPFSRALWLAIDLQIRPPEAGDFDLQSD